MTIATLLLSTSLLSSPPYRGVVIDAQTHQPVVGATVQHVKEHSDESGAAFDATDVGGRILLTGTVGTTVHLRVSSLGYATADLTRPLRESGADTIRLEPASQSLSDVTVRPGQVLTLMAFRKTPKSATGAFMIPSVEMALELPPLPGGKTGTLNQVRLQFRPTKYSVHQGGLRVRLLARPDTSRATAANGPSGIDLLAAPILITAAQAAAAPGGLYTLDLVGQNVTMPANGLYVLLEGYGVTDNQQYVSLTMPSKSHSALLITGTNPQDPKTFEVTKLDEYPQLALGETNDPSITWSRGSNGKGWRLRRPNYGGKKVGNAMIDVLVQAD